MKRTLLFFSFLPHFLLAQYHFDFENGFVKPFLQVPPERWEIATGEAISGSFSLHHSYDNPESGTDYCLFRHDPLRDSDSISFSFRVRHMYAPSSANNWQVALLADFKGRITGGLVLGVNFTGSDDLVSLWKVTEENIEKIGSTMINYQEQAGVGKAPGFRFEWRKEGYIRLFFTPDPDNQPEVLTGVFPLDSLPGGRNLVIRYNYSAARDRGLWMDELKLEGRFIPDIIAPSVTGVKVSDPFHLRVCFSEEILNPDPGSFVLTGLNYNNGTGIGPDSLLFGPGYLLLGFSIPIPNRIGMGLKVTGICDGDRNCLSDTILCFMRNQPEWGDLVFTEIMYDPVPVVRLPDEEYLEIYNRSAYSVEMEGCWWEVEERKKEFSSLIVEPGSFLLLTGIALPNRGGVVKLCSREGVLIHATRYSVPWKGPGWKAEGGWSLESPDPDMVCINQDLWEFSTDPTGGTPGRINSNHSELEDRDPPQLLYVGIRENNTLRVKYSEPVRFSTENWSRIMIVPGQISPDSVAVVMPLSEEMDLFFDEDFPERQIFELHLPEMADCAGNVSGHERIRAGKPGIPRYGDIIINEIMYDPVEGNPEFIELFNVSDQCIDIRCLSLDVVKREMPPEKPLPLSGHSRIVAPGDYLVVSASTGRLMEAYFLELTGCWLEMEMMPGLLNSGGTIYLTDRSGMILDVAHFGDHLQLDLLDDSQGISLERVSADRPGSDPANWHSAASIEGYATPGKENSQSVAGLENGFEEPLTIEPKVFSPDNDGYEDLLQILITAGAGEWVVRLLITDLAGNPVRHLANNHIVGPLSTYTWDGERDDQTMVTEGIYVIHLWGYQPDTGKRWSRKATAGVIYR